MTDGKSQTYQVLFAVRLELASVLRPSCTAAMSDDPRGEEESA